MYAYIHTYVHKRECINSTKENYYSRIVVITTEQQPKRVISVSFEFYRPKLIKGRAYSLILEVFHLSNKEL